jgi:alkaline phosphatase
MKRSLTKITAFLLSLILIFSLIGCNDQTGGSGQSKDYKYKNIIYIIGDGMGEAHLDAGEIVYEKEFAFRDNFKKIMVNTNSLDKKGSAAEVTDSAASATALATGILTVNKHVGMDPAMQELTTILDDASLSGRATGIVTTDYLCGATPAGFSAHTNNRNLEHDIIRTQAKSGVDLLIGQYYDKYLEHESEIKANYKFLKEYDEDTILDSKSDVLCIAPIESGEGSPTLAEVTTLAINRLSKDQDGFLLMIEQAHIDKYSHDKNFEGTAEKANSLNDTVNAALAFAEGRDDTVIIVTADHETCGLKVSASSDEFGSKSKTVSGADISYTYKNGYHTDTPVPFYLYGYDQDFSAFETFADASLIKNNEIAKLIFTLIKVENE